MYFIISKLLYFLILPLNWVITLLLIAAFTKRKKLRRWTGGIAVVLLLVLSCPYLYTVVAWNWDYRRVEISPNKKYSAVIVLGGFTSTDDKQNGYFNAAADRFIQGIRLYEMGNASHILISGGNGQLIQGGYSEGEWTQLQLKQLHIPDSVVLIEGKSRNTYENAKFSKEVLDKNGLKPKYLLVTSAFHMRRALMIFKNQGMDVDAYPCNFFLGGDSFSFQQLMPEFATITYWPIYVKEMVGYMVNSKM